MSAESRCMLVTILPTSYLLVTTCYIYVVTTMYVTNTLRTLRGGYVGVDSVGSLGKERHYELSSHWRGLWLFLR